jgi:phosphoglycolate phosphatase
MGVGTLPVSAVTFDLDGTLVDSAADLHVGCAGMLADLGRPARSLDEIRHFIGEGMKVLVERCLDGEGQTEPALLEAGIDAFRRHYALANGQSASVYPGVREGLAKLAAAAIPMAVVTNKPAAFTEPLLATLGLRDYFGVVVSGDTLPQRKPDPAPLVYAVSALAGSPASAIHVGDSAHDVQAARAAGMQAYWVPYGYAGGAPVDTSEVDALVSDVLDAAERICVLNAV